MYKHITSSIKETDDKQFVSIEEKNKWIGKADGVHDHDNIHYTKEEIDNKFDKTYVTVEGNSISSPSTKGFVKDIEIFGNTEQRVETIVSKPVLTPGSIHNGSGLDDNDPVLLETTYRSGLIDVKNLDKINYYNNGVFRRYNLYLYDRNENFISYEGVVGNTYTVTDPTVSYIRISHNIENGDNTTIEILRTHLDEITSVGVLQENGLYKLGITSVGKNLFNPYKYILNRRGVVTVTSEGEGDERVYTVYNKTDAGKHQDDWGVSSCYVSNNEQHLMDKLLYLDIKKGDTVYAYAEGTFNSIWYAIRDKNKKTLKSDIVYTQCCEVTIDNIPNVAYIEFVFRHSNAYETFTVKNVSIGRGKVVDKFSKYIEKNTDILLHHPLEKVGNVRDRLFIREDGMLCIEKNIGTRILNGYETWTKVNRDYTNKSFIPFYTETPEFMSKNTLGVGCISDKLHSIDKCVGDDGAYTITHECCMRYGNGRNENTSGWIYIVLSKSTLPTEDANGLKTWLKMNNVKIKSQLIEPEIIEVDHMSRILIDSYDTYTNISIDTDLSTTIRCKLPSSITTTIDNNITVIDNIRQSVHDINNMVSTTLELPIEIDKNVNYIENTNCMISNGVSIMGDTLVDIFDNNADMSNSTKDSDGYYTLNVNKGMYDHLIMKQATEFSYKPNTNYTIIAHVIENTSVLPIVVQGFRSNEKTAFIKHRELIPANTTGEFKVKVTTHDDLSKYMYSLWLWHTPNATTDGIVKLKIQIVEGDYTNRDISYFDTISSIGDNTINISSIGKNIMKYDYYPSMLSPEGYKVKYKLDGNICTITENSQMDGGGHISFKIMKLNLKKGECVQIYNPTLPNAVYKIGKHPHEGVTTTVIHDIAFGYVNNSCSISEEGTDTCWLHVWTTMGDSFDVTKFMIFRTNIREYDSKFEQFVSTTKNIQISEPLRGLPSGVRDSIEKINGKYCVIRRCGEIILNGTENWYLDSPSTAPLYSNILAKKVNPSDTNREYSLSSCFSSSSYTKAIATVTTTNTFAFHPNGNIEIRIPDTTPEMFKLYLNNNPITFVYELANPTIEPLDKDIDFQLFERVTNITVDAGPISPIVKIDINNSLPNTIKGIIDKIYVLENKKSKLNRLLLDSVYSADTASYRLNIMKSTNDQEYIEYDQDLYLLIKKCIESKDYVLEDMENKIDFYTLINKISYDVAEYLLNTMYDHHGLAQ